MIQRVLDLNINVSIWGGEKLKRRLICGVLIILLAVVLSGCSINIGNHSTGMNRVEETFDKTVNGDGIKVLEINSPVGSINVTTWDKNEIQIVVKKVNNGLKSKSELLDELKNAEVIFKPEGEKLSIKGYLPKFKNNGMSIQFDISVPKNVTVYNIEAEVGDVRFNRVDGEINIVNNVGKIDVSDCTGKISLKAVTGDVTARNTKLKADSNLTSNVGRVLFDGTIENNGTYRMTTNVGKLDVTLPSSSGFEIDASTNIGDVTCDFDVVGSTDKKGIRGKVNGGGAQLILVNNTGSVSVDKR